MREARKEMPEIKTGKIEQACARYGLGRNTMRKVAGEAGAEIKIGKCYLINFSKNAGKVLLFFLRPFLRAVTIC